MLSDEKANTAGANVGDEDNESISIYRPKIFVGNRPDSAASLQSNASSLMLPSFGEKKANIDDRGRANIQELHNWLIETHKIKQQASMLEDDDRVKHLQGAENELKKALRNIRTAEMEKQKAVAGGDYDRAADISLNLKSYKSAASLKHDLSRDDLRLLSGLKPAGMFPLSTKSIGLDMQEDILGSSRTRKVGSSKTRLSNTRKTNQIEEEDSEDEISSRLQAAPTAATELLVDTDPYFPLASAALSREVKFVRRSRLSPPLIFTTRSSSRKRSEELEKSPVRSVHVSSTSSAYSPPPSTRREESFKSEVRDESRENTWMSSNDLMPPPTIDSRHSPNSETKSDSRQERFPIPPPALSHSHGEGWLLNQVNPSDRGYARKAIGLFGLKTVSNIYAIDWKKRCMAMKYIQERMGKLKTQTDAKHMMHMALPALEHGLNDKLFGQLSDHTTSVTRHWELKHSVKQQIAKKVGSIFVKTRLAQRPGTFLS